jgi:hypothetical protein
MASYVRNLSLASGLPASPHHALYHEHPDTSGLRVFGCRCWILTPKQLRTKLVDNVREGKFIGYVEPAGSRAYQVLLPTGAIVESCNVTFDEQRPGSVVTVQAGERVAAPLMASMSSGVGPQPTSPSVALPAQVPVRRVRFREPDMVEPGEPADTAADVDVHEEAAHAPVEEPAGVVRPYPAADVDVHDEPAVLAEEPAVHASAGEPAGVVMQSANRPVRNRQPVERFDPCAYAATLPAPLSDPVPPLPDPVSLAAARQRPDAAEWEAAVRAEYDSLREKQTWEMVPLPAGAHAIGCRLILERKRPSSEHPKGRYKARVVAQGFGQQAGVDYEETFSPVSKHTTLRAFVAAATAQDWEWRQLDVKTAFLNADLHETVYMRPPPEWGAEPGLVCRLKKAIYGLKQANREWYLLLKSTLQDAGWTQSTADPALFLLRGSDGTVVARLLVYVDDCFIAGRTPAIVQDVLDSIQTWFESRDLGEPVDFLGFEIKRDRAQRIATISQPAYVRKILAQYHVVGLPPVMVPRSPTIVLRADGDAMGEKLDHDLYPRVVGSLQHLANCTRPDIQQAVSTLARYVKAPREAHWKAAIHLLRYVGGTSTYGITFGGTSGLQGFHDADYAACKDTRRSVTGYTFMLNGGAVSYASKVQCTVARSTYEAEYQSANASGPELLSLKRLLHELDVSLPAQPVIHGDNHACLHLLHNPMSTPQSKHIDVMHHWTRERVLAGELDFKYCRSDDNVADVMTKALAAPKFVKFRTAMGVGPV